MCVLIVLSQDIQCIIQNKRHGIFLFYRLNRHFMKEFWIFCWWYLRRNNKTFHGIQLIKSINIVNAVVNGSFPPIFADVWSIKMRACLVHEKYLTYSWIILSKQNKNSFSEIQSCLFPLISIWFHSNGSMNCLKVSL